MNTVDEKDKRRWQWKSVACISRSIDCSEATMETCQDLISNQDNDVLRAVAGLEGGVVSAGSTCGVVQGGALAIGLMHEEKIQSGDVKSELAIIQMAGDYVDWFAQKYKASLCRERIETDLWSLRGFLRYNFPGDIAMRCLIHMYGAMGYLYQIRNEAIPYVTVNEIPHVHCACEVLEGVRKRTGVGNSTLERISVVLDGGVGLRGGACGALSGAVMAVNLAYGINYRDKSYLGSLIKFHTGHRNLRKNKEKCEQYSIGKKVVTAFRDSTGSLECKDIADTKFEDWEAFQTYMKTERCHKVIAMCIDTASVIIEQYK